VRFKTITSLKRSILTVFLLSAAISTYAQGTVKVNPIVCTVSGTAFSESSCGSNFLKQSGSNTGTAQSDYWYFFEIQSATDEPINVSFNYVAATLTAASAVPYSLNPSFCQSADAQAVVAINIRDSSAAAAFWSSTTESKVYRGGNEPGDCSYMSQVAWLNQDQEPIILQLNTNTQYQVSLEVTQSISQWPGDNDFEFAWGIVDPTISWDKGTYPDATLILSDGVSNSMLSSASIAQMAQADLASASAAGATDGPLPIWALVAIGVVLSGTAIRRLRHSSTSA
jgi:hypothetical protein